MLARAFWLPPPPTPPTPQGMKTIFCSELDDHGFDWVADKIRNRVGTGPIYLSLDIDVADPAFAPGTGTPEVCVCSSYVRCVAGDVAFHS